MAETMMHATLALLLALALAGCEAPPASLGISGPARLQPPAELDDSTIVNPGMPDAGNGYGPSIAPSTGGGRYFNYN